MDVGGGVRGGGGGGGGGGRRRGRPTNLVSDFVFWVAGRTQYKQWTEIRNRAQQVGARDLAELVYPENVYLTHLCGNKESPSRGEDTIIVMCVGRTCAASKSMQEQGIVDITPDVGVRCLASSFTAVGGA